jgi:hypothetical protein
VEELVAMEQAMAGGPNLEDIGSFAIGTTWDIPGAMAQFAITSENFEPNAWNNIPAYTTPTQTYVLATAIDREVGGVSGQSGFMFSDKGPVSSDAVENFNLDGRQQIIRRRLENSYGPVATSDHNALLAMAYAQLTNQYYPSEESQYDLIKAI